MNAWIRRVILATPGAGKPYRSARKAFHLFRTVRAARGVFADLDEYRKALTENRPGETTTIKTLDGLRFTIRRNCKDAGILAEIFLDNEYTRYCKLPAAPVVVDIGAYIGDFAIFAAKRLGARKVVALEPSPSNLKLLEKNTVDNGFVDRIQIVKAAVTDGRSILLDIDAPEDAQMRVSSQAEGRSLKEVPGVSLEEALRGIEIVDLLKIDCEGGEYIILTTASDAVLARVRNLVFEFHEIDGFAPQLAAAKKRLIKNGFQVRTHGHLVYATRIHEHVQARAQAV
jgi:FkbM family methyltransferase